MLIVTKTIIHKAGLLVAALLILIISENSISQTGNDFEISKNLDVFSDLYKEIELNYVDDINPGEFMLSGIKSMLKELDPYTVFIPESQIEDYKFMTTGKYGGIGAMIHKKDDYIVISQPYQGFPVDKAGLKAGDKILEINGQSTIGRSIPDINLILKGQSGSNIRF
ncbi:MAG: PDZ domain-containing protein, partial [Bacteroidales bacterium]|nr:PDZ domain-containing protein [Bacteroidales bacterium]